MNIKKIIDFNMDQNCYVINKNNDCIVIDPGDSTDKIKDYIKENSEKADKIIKISNDIINFNLINELEEKNNR